MLSRRSLLLIGVLVFPSVASANPVSPYDVPPDAALLGSFAIEVAIIVAFVWRSRLKHLLFAPAWYLLNLLSFYILVPGYYNLSRVFHVYEVVSAVVIVLGMEAFVVLVEASALYGFARLHAFRTPESTGVSWRRALLASFVANIGSAVGYFLLRMIPGI
jgi:hypothetical protein